MAFKSIVNSEVGLSAVRARHLNFPNVVVHLLCHGLRLYIKKKNRCSQILKYVKSFLFK